MRLLALDTSTRYASIALISEGVEEKDAGASGDYGEYTWYTGNNHNVDILEYMQRLLDECDVTFQDLDGICVATGPGSFNGVRVAVATAKTLAFTLQKPLLGISTLDVLAAQQRYAPQLICALLEAGRGDLYASCYRCEPQVDDTGMLDFALTRQSEYVMLSPTQVAEHVSTLLAPSQTNESQTYESVDRVLFCGEMSNASRQALREALPEQSLFASRNQSMRHASVLAALGYQRLRTGQTDDPLLLEPLYLRRPSITTSTRKQPRLGVTEHSTQQSAVQSEREEGALHH